MCAFLGAVLTKKAAFNEETISASSSLTYRRTITGAPVSCTLSANVSGVRSTTMNRRSKRSRYGSHIAIWCEDPIGASQ
jgi:hypothetical protein